MSVLFMDSVAHYVTADIGKKWTTSSGATVSATAGRRGGPALGLSSSSGSATYTLSATYAGLILGFAAKVAVANTVVCAFRDGGTQQVHMNVAADGVVSVIRAGTNTTLGSSAPGAVPINSWCYIEISVVIHNTAGAVTVKVNGTTVISLTSVDTQNTANAYITDFTFGHGSSTGTSYFGDIYLIDTATTPNTTFLGDVRVDAYYPTTDGASLQWTPTPSGAHYAVVDETAPNGTDHIQADVAGYIDLFGVQDLAVVPAAFYAVQVCAAALKTDAGSRQIKSVVRRGVTNYAGTAKDVSETQKYILNQWNTDPSTAAAWTKAGFDAAEFGVELV